MTQNDDGAKVIAEALAVNTTLKNLHCDCSEIEVEGAVALATALTSNNTLEKLSLMYNIFIAAEGAKAFAKALERNRSLKDLNLNLCLIGKESDSSRQFLEEKQDTQHSDFES